jgi:hypothetical protein
MRNLLILILCCGFFAARSQSKPADVKTINVYARDGKSVIGKVMVNTAAPGNLFLLKTIQKKDSTNHYLTTFYLGNKETAALLGVKILMKFSKPVMAVDPSYTVSFNNVNGLADDGITYIFKAARLERDAGSAVVISFAIKSKEKVVAEISGLAGTLP